MNYQTLYAETHVDNIQTLDNTKILLGLRLAMLCYVSICWCHWYRCCVDTPVRSDHWNGLWKAPQDVRGLELTQNARSSCVWDIGHMNWSEIHWSTSISMLQDRWVSWNDRVDCIANYHPFWHLEWVHAYQQLMVLGTSFMLCFGWVTMWGLRWIDPFRLTWLQFCVPSPTS
jgi:hypothetical protein